MSHLDCDVLVIGLGPVGDVMAGLLARQGLRVIAIDREQEIFPLPRAAVFDHEIMRIFQMLGVAECIEPLCRVVDRYQFVTTDRQVLLDFAPMPQSPLSGWAESYALHQPAVEAVLRQRLGELGVDVRLGTSFVGLTQSDQDVTVSVSGPNGPSAIRANYIVGCDGASSRVRETLGISLFDYQFDEPWLVLDALCDNPGDLPVTCLQICNPDRPVTYLAMSAPRFRWEFMLKPGETGAQITDDASIAALLAPWKCLDRIRIERKAIYRFHGLVADKWRQGRVLLAGDAAHQMPPFAGQGMCSGIRDASNLAWKLVSVIREKAGGRLLDTYQTEREPHVRAVIETAIAMGRVVCLLDTEAAALRNADMLARKAAGAQDVAMAWPDLHSGCLADTACAGTLFPQAIVNGARLDDALGHGAWLIGRDLPAMAPAWIRLVDVNAPILSEFAPELVAWLDKAGADAVLVRPDRHVFGVGSAEWLLDQWRAAMGSSAE